MYNGRDKFTILYKGGDTASHGKGRTFYGRTLREVKKEASIYDPNWYDHSEIYQKDWHSIRCLKCSNRES